MANKNQISKLLQSKAMSQMINSTTGDKVGAANEPAVSDQEIAQQQRSQPQQRPRPSGLNDFTISSAQQQALAKRELSKSRVAKRKEIQAAKGGGIAGPAGPAGANIQKANPAPIKPFKPLRGVGRRGRVQSARAAEQASRRRGRSISRATGGGRRGRRAGSASASGGSSGIGGGDEKKRKAKKMRRIAAGISMGCSCLGLLKFLAIPIIILVLIAAATSGG